MSGRRVLIQPQANVSGVAMGVGTAVSNAIDARYVDNVAFEVIWTGTPSGQLFVDACLDANSTGPGLSGGTWMPIQELSGTNSPAGSAGQALFNIAAAAFPFLRLRYVGASGSGAMTVWVCGKGA